MNSELVLQKCGLNDLLWGWINARVSKKINGETLTKHVLNFTFFFFFLQAMLKINEQMHKIWKNQVEEKPLQSSFSNWVKNLPFDTKVKEWLAAEEQYKQEVQVKNILPAVADKLLIDWKADRRGASILCFDEIQVSYNCAFSISISTNLSSDGLSPWFSIICKYTLINQ